MSRSWQYSLLIYLLLFCCHLTATDSDRSPKIIFLKGSCSSGKTSSIGSLDLSRLHLEIVDEDSLVFRRYPEAVQQRFPEEFACIEKAVKKENLYPALRTEQIAFKEGSSEEERQKAQAACHRIKNALNQACNLAWKERVSHSITTEVLEKIANALANNKNVLLDAWYIKPEQLQELFPNAQTVRVLLYTPLSQSYERLQKRNQKALASRDLSQHRMIGQLVCSFCNMYQISTESHKSIEKVDPAEYDALFRKISLTLGSDDTPKQTFTFKEISKNKLQAIRDEFLQPFLKEPELAFYIHPKEEYEYIIKSSVSEQERRDIFQEIVTSKSLPSSVNP